MKTRNWYKSIIDLIYVEKYIYRVRFRDSNLTSWAKNQEIHKWATDNEMDFVYDDPDFYFKSLDDFMIVKLTYDDIETEIQL